MYIEESSAVYIDDSAVYHLGTHDVNSPSGILSTKWLISWAMSFSSKIYSVFV